MKKKILSNLAIGLLLQSLSLVSWSQSANSYQFIEPNVAIRFDSNVYKIQSRNSNTSYEIASFDFIKKDDTAHHVLINVEASHSDLKPTKDLQRNLMNPKDKLNDLSNDHVALQSTEEKTVAGFTCVAMIAQDNTNGRYGTLIKGLKLFDGGYCEISYYSFGRNDLQKEYKILGPFLSGFISYSKKQISDQDALIKSMYTIQVDTLATSAAGYTKRTVTFHGIVKVKQNLEHKVAEVRLTDNEKVQAVFYAAPNGEVEIIATDTAMGKITKQGELIILNSFGKKVHLPFNFTYMSRGE
jgi:hypothetical protein